MKICVVILSQAATASAGVRIRYNRIEATLAAGGHSLRLAVVQDLFANDIPDDDVFILSKSYDARSVILADRLRRAGKVVGIDLFDDYFSHVRDSRFLRFREWIATIAPHVDFTLCSTPGMAQVAERFVVGRPAHVMNDPSPEFGVEALRTSLAAKLERARATGVIKVCWFGIGGNAHFPLGLTDLAAFGETLARLQSHGFDVQLAIRTNSSALTVETAACLRTLPIPYSLDEWTIAGERALLEESLISFLPVNAQDFSVVKSLNRALSALSHGTQVLSPGYPLYAPLAPFIYADPIALMEDIRAGTPALRGDTLQRFGDLVEEIGSADTEATKLVAMLEPLLADARPAEAAGGAKVAVIQGVRSNQPVHDFAKAARVFSVASPYCTEDWPFDMIVRFLASGSGLEILLAETMWVQLPPRILATLRPATTVNGRRYRAIGLDPALGDTLPTIEGINATLHPIQVMAGYRSVIDAVTNLLKGIFPEITCLMADRSVYPFSAGNVVPVSTKEAVLA